MNLDELATCLPPDKGRRYWQPPAYLFSSVASTLLSKMALEVLTHCSSKYLTPLSVSVGLGKMPRSMRTSNWKRLSPSRDRAWGAVRYLKANSNLGVGTMS